MRSKKDLLVLIVESLHLITGYHLHTTRPDPPQAARRRVVGSER